MKFKWFKTIKQNGIIERKTGGGKSQKESENWNQIIKLYPNITFNNFQSFGGALTESSAYVYSKMSQEDKQTVLNSYFNENEMGYHIVRIPIDSCDFSLENYEAFIDPSDETMEHLDFSRSFRYIKCLLDDAEKVSNNKLKLLLSSWSPPSFMKTNGERNHGGKLKLKYYAVYARYLCRYIQEFIRMGYEVERITVQNEPEANQSWDSCIFEAEEEKIFIHKFLYPTLKAEHLEHIEIFFWDHNKDQIIDRVQGTLDYSTVPEIAGLAFHWYSGDHFEQLNYFKEKYPDKKLLLTEFCVAPENPLQSAENYAHEIIGDLNAGTEAIYDWNILLDSAGGPNHVQNYCEAPFMYDIDEKKLIRNLSVDYLWHFSHFIKQDALRIAFSKYSCAIEMTAFKNRDGSIVAVFLNTDTDKHPIELHIESEVINIVLDADSITSAQIIS